MARFAFVGCQPAGLYVDRRYGHGLFLSQTTTASLYMEAILLKGIKKKLLAAFLGCPNLCRARPTSEFSTQQCADAARLHHGYCLPGYPHAGVVAIGSEFVVPAHPRIVSPVYAPT